MRAGGRTPLSTITLHSTYMRITGLDLIGLRGFASTQTVRFAVPSGTVGSGLTILIGPNNGGKSTVIEALRALNARDNLSFTEGKRNKRAGDRVSIIVSGENGVRYELRTVTTGGSEIQRDPPTQPFRIYVLPSRRYFNPYFGRSHHERQSYNIGLSHNRGAALDGFSGRLFTALRSRSKFDAVLRRVLDPVPDWTIDQSDTGQHYLKFNVSGQYHTSDGLGEGIVSLFFIIDALYDSSSSDIIVIDEPELSLHPALQRRLANLLAEYAKDRQIMYATHSPYFVDFNHVLNGAEIVRIHKPDTSCKVSQLTRQTTDDLKGFLSNFNNPHILGLDAREAFFKDDGIILVEGQEDVVFYSRLSTNLADRFFGWGVGGADNMKVIAALLTDLGFTKVCGILDANKKDIASRLCVRFPSYLFVTIPADDVRTKPVRQARPATCGLHDENGNLRPEFEQFTKDMFKKLASYLSGIETT